MSMYGDKKMYMEYLYNDIKEFFENGGTVAEFHKVISDYFEE